MRKENREPDMDAPRIIQGPTAEIVGGPPLSIIYNVTLPSGVVLTSPAEFGSVQTPSAESPPFYVAEDGRPLMPSSAPLDENVPA